MAKDIPLLPRQIVPEEELIRREKYDVSEFKKMIRDMGLKVTHQRLGILETLHHGRQHMTAQEVYEEVSANYPEIGFATVYRLLRKLSEHGFVTELRMGGLPARYELAPKRHHDHMTCVTCGKIFEFENHEIEALQEKVAAASGLRLTSHVLELYGECTKVDCSGKKKLKV